MDAVESVHETFAGKRIGSYGVGEVFSFHSSKLLNGCEGGYVCTDDETFFQSLLAFRDGGDRGINCHMNELHAILALASLAEIENNVKHNKEIYSEYMRLLASVPFVKLIVAL